MSPSPRLVPVLVAIPLSVVVAVSTSGFVPGTAVAAPLAAPVAAPLAAPVTTPAAEDTAGPVIVEHTVTPTIADLSDGPVTVTLRTHITDDTGVAPTTFYGWHSWGQTFDFGPAELVEGTPQDGVWESTLVLPQDLPNGELEVGTIGLSDTVGNLTDAWSGDTVFTTGGTPPEGDLDGPAVSDVTVDPASWNLEDGPGQFTVSARVTDESGAVGPAFTVRHRGGQSLPVEDPAMRLASGTEQDGIWQATFTLPTTAIDGTWEVGVDSGQDTLGNYGYYAVTPVEITGGSGADAEAPVIERVTASPGTVDLAGGDGTVTVRVHVTDETGTQAPWFLAEHASGQVLVGDNALELVEGTAQDGIWQAELAIPATSVNGLWTVSVFPNSDVLGNNPPADNPVLAEVEVSGGSGTDVLAPTVQDVSVDPATVDLAAGPTLITLRARLTDQTGSMAPEFTLVHSATGQTMQATTGNPYGRLVEGTAQDGVWEREVLVPTDIPDGDWEITATVHGDELGNVHGGQTSATTRLAVAGGTG